MGLCLSDLVTSCYIFVKIKLCVLYLVRFCYILSYFITWCYIFFEYQIACVTIPSWVHSRRVTCNFPCALSASSHLLKLNQFYQQQKRIISREHFQLEKNLRKRFVYKLLPLQNFFNCIKWPDSGFEEHLGTVMRVMPPLNTEQKFFSWSITFCPVRWCICIWLEV